MPENEHMSTTASRASAGSLSIPLSEGSDEMHRSYQSILPCHNKLLQKRWDKTYYDEHRRKVANVTSMVDTKPPQTFMHLHLKLKKLQLEEDRLDVIERDNKLLLEKMAYIMRTKGRVDNYNDYTNKSLNAEKREREQLRISVENKNILRRILNRQPVYSHRAWLEDWKKNRLHLNKISHFPNEWWKKTKGGGSQKRTSKQSIRNTRSKILSTSGKDDDEYSQVYETDDEEDAAGTDTNQKSPKSEVSRKENEKHKTVEGNEENMEAGTPVIEKNNEDKENTEKDEKQEPKG